MSAPTPTVAQCMCTYIHPANGAVPTVDYRARQSRETGSEEGDGGGGGGGLPRSVVHYSGPTHTTNPSSIPLGVPPPPAASVAPFPADADDLAAAASSPGASSSSSAAVMR